MTDKMMRIAGRSDDGLAKAIKTDSQGFLEAKITGNNKIETLWSNQSSLDGEWVDLTDGFILVGDKFKELMISWSADTVTGRTFTIEAIWSSSTGSADRQTLSETLIVAKDESLSAFKKVDVKRSHVKLRYKVDGGDHSRSIIQALWSADSSPTVDISNMNDDRLETGSGKVETLWNSNEATDGVWYDLTDGFIEVGGKFNELMISWTADTVTGRTFTIEATWDDTGYAIDRSSFTETVIRASNDMAHAYKQVSVKRKFVKLRYKVDGANHSRAVIQCIFNANAYPRSMNIDSFLPGLNKKQTLSNGVQIEPQESYVLVSDFQFNENVTAWALYAYERNRPTSNIVNGVVEFVIEYSDTKGDYGSLPGGRLLFKQAVTLSQDDERGKGLVVLPSNDSSQGSNIVLAGEYFNVPIGKYMRITIKNNMVEPAIRFLPITIVQEGNFDVV